MPTIEFVDFGAVILIFLSPSWSECGDVLQLLASFISEPSFFILGLALHKEKSEEDGHQCGRCPLGRQVKLELWASAKLETFETIEWYDRLFTNSAGLPPRCFSCILFFAMPTRHHNWGDERFPWLRDCQMWHLARDRYQNAEPTTKPFGYAPNGGLAMAKRATFQRETWDGQGRIATFCTWIHRFWVAFWVMLLAPWISNSKSVVSLKGIARSPFQKQQTCQFLHQASWASLRTHPKVSRVSWILWSHLPWMV